MKKTLIALSIIPAISFAFTASQKQMEVLHKLGLPTPETRIQLVHGSQPSDSSGRAHAFLAESREMKKNGFINRTSDRAAEIFNIKEKLEKQYESKSFISKPKDTDIRENPEDIIFAYTYVGTPRTETVEYYGIAPVGTYVNEGQKGWTGAVEFYKTSFATCAYTEKNMLAANGSARLYEDQATRDVNGKVTFVDIEGNESSGFLYRVHWFDDIFNRDLECATMNFSESVTNSVIELAKKIDSNAQ